MSLNASQVDSISRQVYRQFPELKGERPTVQRQALASGAKAKGSGAAPERYVLTFKGRQRTADGRTLTRIVRATADERGRVLKISTSK